MRNNIFKTVEANQHFMLNICLSYLTITNSGKQQ